MKWNYRSEKEPDPSIDKYILVIGVCGKPHVAYWDYDDWHHTECCHGVYHSPGGSIDFDRWISFSNQPERLNPEDKDDT